MEITYSSEIQADGGVRPLTSALRTVGLLKVFTGSSQPLRLAEVAARAELSRATAYQRLLTLQEAGFLEQLDDSRWRLTLWPLELAAAALDQADVSARVEPLLADLAHEAGETASLALLHRNLPTIVARVEGDRMLRAAQKIGTTMDLAESASGRILVAFAAPEVIERLQAAGVPLPPDAVLDEVRRQGWALSTGLSQVGVRAVAVPVRGSRGQCRGALSLVMPEQRFHLEPLLPLLLRTGAALSRLYHGTPQPQPHQTGRHDP